MFSPSFAMFYTEHWTKEPLGIVFLFTQFVSLQLLQVQFPGQYTLRLKYRKFSRKYSWNWYLWKARKPTGRREKLSSGEVSMKVSVYCSRTSEAGLVVQSCPELGQWAHIFMWTSVWTSYSQAAMRRSHNLGEWTFLGQGNSWKMLMLNTVYWQLSSI